jgi:tetratricopeptide (TPR) repeat protein
MHFENRSRSKELDWLREGMADMIITNLSRSPKLTVLSRQQLRLLLERMPPHSNDVVNLDEALGIARASKAEVFLVGSFARLVDKVRVEAQLYESNTGRLLAAEYLVVDRPEQILDQIDLLSWKIAAHLDAALGDRNSQKDLSRVMTDNLDAYRYYSLGLEKAQGLHTTEAIEFFEKAIVEDPRFAMAHARIGFAYAVTWGYPEKGKPYLERAFKLSDRLTEKDKLYISAWYAIAKLDYPGAIDNFRQLLAAHPSEVEAYFRLGRLLQGEERLDEALEVARHGLVIDPEAKDLHNLMGGVYSDLGRHVEAIASHQRYVALAPGEPNAFDSLGLSYQWAGSYAEAIKQYERALALDPEFEIAVVHLGNTYFQQGRYRDALAQFRRYIQLASTGAERARGYGCIAHVQRVKGDLALAEQAARMEFSNDKASVWNSTIVAFARGNMKAAEGFKKQMMAEWPYTERGRRPTLRYFRYLGAYLDLKAGRSVEAVEGFREVVRHRPIAWNIDSYEDSLAAAYVELGRLDEAITEYERILQLNQNYPLAHYYLAQAYERKGDRVQARTSYERFLVIWKDADPELPQVVTARNYLASTL